MDKTIVLTEMQLQEDDIIYLCSDGVIHAGVGQTLNFGWQWEHVANYVTKNQKLNAELLSRRLLGACNDLYAGMPGDDTTIVTVKIRKPVQILLFTGPPVDQRVDGHIVHQFMRQKGKKIVCGGTAANIVSRELEEPIHTCIDYLDPNIPPTARIKGLDLVTEGVITLKRTIELLEQFAEGKINVSELAKDGASLLCKMLIEDATHIDFWLGKAMNGAHQNPDFPKELSLKINLVQELVEVLERIGKKATIRYVSEVKHEKV